MITRDHRPKNFKEVLHQPLAKKILQAIAKDPVGKPRTILLYGKFGLGKCVGGRTYVPMQNGLRRIQELFPYMEGRDKSIESDLVVHTLYGVEKLSHIYYGGKRLVRKIETDYGLGLTASLNHPVMSWCDRKMEFVWKQAQSLKVGDTLVSCYRSLVEEVGFDPLGYFLGLMAGDGSYVESNVPTFQSTDQELLTFVRDFYNKNYGKVSEFTDTRSKGYLCLRLLGSKDLFDKWGVYGESCANKTIPKVVLNGSWDRQISFVQGLMDSDGSVDIQNNVEYSSNSRKLTEYVMAIAGSLGIMSKMRKKDKSYRVTFLRSCYMKSLFRMSRKLDRIKRLKNDLQSRKGRVPGSLRWAKKFYEERGPWSREERREISLFQNINRMKDDYPISSFKHFLKILSERGYQVPILFEGVEFLKVIKISNGKELTYDVVNPVSHSFISNNIVSHNSTLARVFARALNCNNFKAGDVCGRCENCSFNILSAPYYEEYDSSISGRISALREIQDTFYQSSMVRWRVVVFDEAQVISKEAQAALLHVTEDVPSNIFIIFATTDPEKLSDPLRSRFLELELFKAPISVVQERIKYLSRERKVKVNESTERLIIDRAQGHFRSVDMMFELFEILGEKEFVEGMKGSKNLIYSFIVASIEKDRNQAESAINKIHKIPLAYVRQDFERVLVELSKAAVQFDMENPVRKLALTMGTKVFTLVKYFLSPWTGSAFRSDRMLESYMWSIYFLLSKQ